MQVRLLQAIDDGQERIERMLEIIQQNQVKQSFRLGLGVKVADFDMPFWALVGILIRVSLAAIPAGIFLGLVFGPLAVGLLRLFRGY